MAAHPNLRPPPGPDYSIQHGPPIPDHVPPVPFGADPTQATEMAQRNTALTVKECEWISKINNAIWVDRNRDLATFMIRILPSKKRPVRDRADILRQINGLRENKTIPSYIRNSQEAQDLLRSLEEDHVAPQDIPTGPSHAEFWIAMQKLLDILNK